MTRMKFSENEPNCVVCGIKIDGGNICKKCKRSG